jgi:hypothetical protein
MHEALRCEAALELTELTSVLTDVLCRHQIVAEVDPRSLP